MGTIRTLARFRNQDITSDINHRLRNLVKKGVFYGGGQVSPVAGALEIDIQPFSCMGADGMVTILEGSSERLTVGVGNQWVLIHAEYRSNDTAIAELEVLTESQYNALTANQKAARVKLAHLNVSVGASEVTSDDITYIESDFTDPVMRSAFRGNFDSVGYLPDYTNPPTGVSQFNREGDLAFVISERLFYSWDISGTHQWRPVISSAGEAALDDHRNNEDDGTVPPDLFEALHLTTKERHSLDSGSGSELQYGGDGFEFNTGNPPLDFKYPLAVRTRDVINTGGPATSIQLSGKAYVGHGAIGTAERYFRLSTGSTTNPLFSSVDGGPIVVLSVFDGSNTFQINPSTDADAFGFVSNPWIRMDFSGTADSTYNGNIGVEYGEFRGIGEVDIAPLTMTAWTAPWGGDARISGQNFNRGLSSLTDWTAQGLADFLNASVAPLDNKVVSVGPIGSRATYVGASQSAFQSAINDAPDGTKIVVLPGVYTFSTPVLVSNRKNIEFVGVTRAGNTNATVGVAFIKNGGTNDTLFNVSTCNNIAFSGLSFDELKPRGGLSTGALFEFASSGTTSSIKFKNCKFLFESGTNNNYTPTLNFAGGAPFDGVEILDCFFEMAAASAARVVMLDCLNYTINSNVFDIRGGAGTTTSTAIIDINYVNSTSTTAKGNIENNQFRADIDGRVMTVMVPNSTSTKSSVVIKGNNIKNDVGGDGYTCLYLGATGTEAASGSQVVVDQNTILWNQSTTTTAATVILEVDATIRPGTLHIRDNHWDTGMGLMKAVGAIGGTWVTNNWFRCQLDNTGSNYFDYTSGRIVVWDANYCLLVGDGQVTDNMLLIPGCILSNSIFKRVRITPGGDATQVSFPNGEARVQNCTFDWSDASIQSINSTSVLRFTTEGTVTGCSFLGNDNIVLGSASPALYCPSHNVEVSACSFTRFVIAVDSAATISGCTSYECPTFVTGDGSSVVTGNLVYLGMKAPRVVIYGSVVSGNNILGSDASSGSWPTNATPSLDQHIVIHADWVNGNNIEYCRLHRVGIRVRNSAGTVSNNSIRYLGTRTNSLSTDQIVGVYISDNILGITVSSNSMYDVGSADFLNSGIGVYASGVNQSGVDVCNNNFRTLYGTDSYGIVDKAYNSTISNNTISSVRIGIEYKNQCMITGNYLASVRGIITADSVSNSTVSSNRITLSTNLDPGDVASGIIVTGRSSVCDNHISADAISVDATGTGGPRPIIEASGSENTICNNHIKFGYSRGVAIYVREGINNVVNSNYFYGDLGFRHKLTITETGSKIVFIFVYASDRTSVVGNVVASDLQYANVTNRGEMILLESSDRCTVVANTFRHGGSNTDAVLRIEPTCNETLVGLNNYDGGVFSDSGVNTAIDVSNP